MPEETKRSLVRKLSEVMAAVSHVPKSGRNNFHNYDYATEADITASVRQELAKRMVMLIPSVESCEFLEVVTNANKKERICTMRMTFTAHDGESGETIPFNAVGQGQDASDKAAYKAATGATKYALLKLFLIPTGDDPEEDSKPAPKSAPPKPKTPDLQTVNKLVAAFAGLGVQVAQLEDRIGKPIAEVTEADIASLREYHKKKKELASESPEALALRLEKEAAEKGIAAEQAKVRAKIDAQMKALDGPAKPDAVARVKLFESFVVRIRAAATPPECVLLSAEFGQSGLPASDLKILERQATDRALILNDAIKQKERKLVLEAPSDLTQ